MTERGGVSIKITSVEEAEAWINIHQRMLIKDIKYIVNLQDRVAWLSQPWRKRIFRKPPHVDLDYKPALLLAPMQPRYDIFALAEETTDE